MKQVWISLANAFEDFGMAVYSLCLDIANWFDPPTHVVDIETDGSWFQENTGK